MTLICLLLKASNELTVFLSKECPLENIKSKWDFQDFLDQNFFFRNVTEVIMQFNGKLCSI